MNIKEQCLKIYKESFEECLPFEKLLFSEAFEYCRYICDGEKVASILFAIPCFLETKMELKKCIYIFAAATSLEYRNCGYMKKLLETVKSDEDGILFLRPANKGLIEVYKKSGFQVIKAINSSDSLPKIKPSKVLETISKDCIFENGEEITLMCYPYESEMENIGFIYSME